MNTHISGENLDSKFQSESYDYPYYLRGFKAINKEIEMIKNRSINENDLMTEGYFKIKQKLLIIDSDDRSKELLRAREIINKEKATEWLNFNFELAETENLKNSQIYISIAIMIGLFFGIFYVLMSNTFKQRKNF